MNTLSYAEFKKVWLESVVEGEPSSVELGRRFSKKIIGDWLDFNADAEDVIYCDGSGDGGIDIAYLMLGDILEDGSSEGNTWYLVQSKHGSAFNGKSTILIEGEKIIDNLNGDNDRLSSIGDEVSRRVRNFIACAGDNDKLKIIYATHDPLSEEDKRGVDHVRRLGRSHFGDLFDVDAISIQTIYNRLAELSSNTGKIKIQLTANLTMSGSELWVGAVSLINIYEFLKFYKRETGDLDQLYEKNVRKYLGGGRVVNKGIAQTLKKDPEKFGLFNNGITIVAEDVVGAEKNYVITEPYIVNGCQTTKTIWQVMVERLDSGASRLSSELEEWKNRLSNGIVILKIVKVSPENESELNDITRYTNSQNSVSRQDFIALESDFRTLAAEFAKKYKVYLEIHRGGWESQKMLQKHSLNANKYLEYVNAFDMLKVYGAAWFSEPGMAYGKNPPFAPGGAIFKRIMDSTSFGVDALYACYLLQCVANKIKFGRTAEKQSRGQTRYLFYYIIMDLIKDILINENRSHGLTDLTHAVIKIYGVNHPENSGLTDIAINVVDNYLADGNSESLYTEPEYIKSKDLNGFLKWEKLGKGRDFTPKLEQQLYANKYLMRQSLGGQKSVRDRVLDML